jgi:hypothetical protein
VISVVYGSFSEDCTLQTARIPKASHHKASGQAVVRLNGKDYYLGGYGSAQAKANYERLISRWLANGRNLPDPESGLTVNDIILAYDHHTEGYYQPSGKISSELGCTRDTLKIVKALSNQARYSTLTPQV